MTQVRLALASEETWAPPESQVNPGNLAMLKTGFLGLLGLKERPEQLDIPGPPAPLAPLASVTPPSVPTLPALLLAQGM